MSELFNIPESKLPRLQWIDKHGVWTSPTKFIDDPNPRQAWTATSAGINGVGPTEDDAIVDLAKHMGIKLWMES